MKTVSVQRRSAGAEEEQDKMKKQCMDTTICSCKIKKRCWRKETKSTKLKGQARRHGGNCLREREREDNPNQKIKIKNQKPYKIRTSPKSPLIGVPSNELSLHTAAQPCMSSWGGRYNPTVLHFSISQGLFVHVPLYIFFEIIHYKKKSVLTNTIVQFQLQSGGEVERDRMDVICDQCVCVSSKPWNELSKFSLCT